MDQALRDKHIIFYDGDCVFCSWWVNAIIRSDKKDNFRFARLQSSLADNELKRHKELTKNIDSIVMIKGDRIWIKSDVPLHVFFLLGFPYNILSVCKIIPKFLRDSTYALIANNRYRIFGKINSCDLPNEDIRYKFL